MSRLNAGPAKHPVVAISGMPFLAIARLADKSPMLLPHAKTVMPSIDAGIRLTVPRNCSKLTSKSAIVSIHVAAMKNP